jgi:pantoate--beta-alanine ligase
MTAVFRTISEIRTWILELRTAGQVIGLVPTMGALHEGHLSLIRVSKSTCDRTILTVFVNPTQFGPGEDLENYPKNFDRDLRLATELGVDAVFHPTTAEMYPEPTVIFVEPGKLAGLLCGQFRPGHFRGVATVVAKLFHICEPHMAYFGQKDGQQSVIIQRMVRDLNLPVQIEICPTVRELDGLAVSSRNSYLSAEDRQKAAVLYRALQAAETMVRSGVRSRIRLEDRMQEVLRSEQDMEIQYAHVVDRETLEPLPGVMPESMLGAMAAVAVRIGSTHLIDNIILGQAD